MSFGILHNFMYDYFRRRRNISGNLMTISNISAERSSNYESRAENKIFCDASGANFTNVFIFFMINFNLTNIIHVTMSPLLLLSS